MESQTHLADEADGDKAPVDSDEERDAVMAALARSRPRPLYTAPLVPLHRKYQMIRIKEMMASALGGGSGGGGGGGGGGRGGIFGNGRSSIFSVGHAEEGAAGGKDEVRKTSVASL